MPKGIKKMDMYNAKVVSTWIGLEDHGIPSFSITLKYERGNQGYGGYDLRAYNLTTWLVRILNIFEVNTWEELIGKPCRIERSGGLIKNIGNLMEDDWIRTEDLEKFELPKTEYVERRETNV